jgi:hypothetical protein
MLTKSVFCENSVDAYEVSFLRKLLGGEVMKLFEADAFSHYIDDLRMDTSSDFVALALSLDDGWKYHWHYASGSANYRYKRMTVKRGKGLPGLALTLGRTVTSEGANGLKLECALMVVEGLCSAAAIPIGPAAGEIGVMMVGSRQPYVYSSSELQLFQNRAAELEAQLQLDTL